MFGLCEPTASRKGSFVGRIPTGAYQYGSSQILVREEETIVIESEVLEASSRKEKKKKKEKSRENLQKTPDKEPAAKEKIDYANTSEKGYKDAIGVETLVAQFVIPLAPGEELSYLNIGGQIGWERAWDMGFLHVGFNPQVSFGGLADNSFVGFSPAIFAGVEEEKYFSALALYRS